MYSKKHKETEFIETIRMLLPHHPELKDDINNKYVDLTKYMPKESLTFSTASNLYDIPDDNVVIMRYMDYKKFSSLIENSELYMSAPKYFDQDSSEGYLIPDVGKFIDAALETAYKQLYDKIKSNTISVSGIRFTGIESVDKKLMRDRCSKIYKHNLKRFFISCWTERDIDQDNMWKAYIRQDREHTQEEKLKTAVAIKTTVGKLKKALAQNIGLFAITRVKYVDLDTHQIENIDFLAGGMWSLACYMLKLKDKPYEDDREIRLISDNLMTNRTQWYKMSVMAALGAENFDYNAEPDYSALRAPLILDDFIDEIITSPFSDDGFINELKLFLASKGLNNFSIKKSAINKKRTLYWDSE